MEFEIKIKITHDKEFCDGCKFLKHSLAYCTLFETGLRSAKQGFKRCAKCLDEEQEYVLSNTRG